MGFKRGLIKFGLALKKHSPKILAVVGTVSTVGGVVWACKSTMDSADDIKKAHNEIEEVKASMDSGAIEIKDGKRAIRSARVECFKCVAPRFIGPVVMIGGGLYSLLKSGMIYAEWLAATSSALKSEHARRELLEENVRREYGQEALERLKYGLYDDTAEIRTTNDKNVEIGQIEGFNEVLDRSKVGHFTYIFDKRSNRYMSSADHCENYFDTIEKIFTQRLQTNGVLWLWEVLRDLDIKPETPEAAKFAHNVCWIYDPSDKNKDCYVSLRAKRVYDGDSRNFKSGFEPVYIIDPNYDSASTSDWFPFMK